jgi:chromosome segregation ATPase
VLSRRTQQSKHDELQAQIDEQAALIESLRTDKAKMETDYAAVKVQADRSQKENALLRRAVTLQQDKHHQIESQLRDAKSSKAQADEKIRVLEQMVVTLRYHLQAAQVPAGSGQMNDFMPPRPPDVY